MKNIILYKSVNQYKSVFLFSLLKKENTYALAFFFSSEGVKALNQT